jgi:cytochrome c oxidase accessory protein FixG
MAETIEATSFRDSVSTIDEQGKRKWIFPKKPKGSFHNKRIIFSVALLSLLFAGPWISIKGKPILLLNVLERKFIIFGQVFWPQDFHLFVLAMITGIVFITLFTVVYGRLFCGWACPQTVFMEMVFRKIEYLIEGDYKQQMKLNAQPWDKEKITKKAFKHTLFIFISFLISHTFLAYIIGKDALLDIQSKTPGENLTTAIALTIFTGVFYFVFAWFREQVCLIACPYGRLQGVMLDRNSVVVAYDHVRGEGRGKFKKNENRNEVGKGDCIDCHQCVDVCPTGIDIRNGTQLECINCTACIDACDTMMEGVGLEKGLIRYDSADGIVKREKFHLNGRSKAYTVVLMILLSVITFLLASRKEFETILLRTPGMLYQEKDNGIISNLYNIKMVNKSFEEKEISLQLKDLNGNITIVGRSNFVLKPESVAEGSLFIEIPKSLLKKRKNNIEVNIVANGEIVETVETKFLAPI